MHILDDALRMGYVRGSVLLRERYAAPWAVSIPHADELRTILGCNRLSRPVAFHLVEYGDCHIRVAHKKPVRLSAGDVAICFGGVSHEVATGAPTRAVPVRTLLTAGARTPARPSSAGVALLCGVFTLQDTGVNPLLAALPTLVRASTAQPGALHNLSGAARLLVEEVARVGPSGSYVTERLLDIVCAETIRAHIETSHDLAGWFRGLKDPVIGRVIAAMHRAPGAQWSIPRLAREVSLSPSRFGARFSSSVGESPMSYLTRWRMNIACRRLATLDEGIEDIATAVGYESVPAFTRAFKRMVGLAPGQFRKRAVSSATDHTAGG